MENNFRINKQQSQPGKTTVSFAMQRASVIHDMRILRLKTCSDHEISLTG